MRKRKGGSCRRKHRKMTIDTGILAYIAVYLDGEQATINKIGTVYIMLK